MLESPGPYAYSDAPRRALADDMRPAWVLGAGLLSIACPALAPLAWLYGARITESYVMDGLDPPVTAVIGRRVAGALTILLVVASGAWVLAKYRLETMPFPIFQ